MMEPDLSDRHITEAQADVDAKRRALQQAESYLETLRSARAPRPAAALERRPAVRERPGAKLPPASSAPTVDKILTIVAAHPEGITVADIISEGRLSQSYAYDVIRTLVQKGRIKKRGAKRYPA